MTLIVQDKVNLTRREREICVMILLGKSVKVTARLLNLSVNTVEKHRENIRGKFGVHNVQSVVYKLFEMGDLPCL